MKKTILILAFIVAGATVSTNAQMDHGKMAPTQITVNSKIRNGAKYQELNKAMRELWSAHMYWTLITVDAFFNDPKGLNAKLGRLLQNQKDIGTAVAGYYGQAAGDQLTKLLTEHIQDAVPVLQAAKDNNKEALDKAVKDWYANAKEIGDLLHNANPKNWSIKDTEGVLQMHITHTIAYSVAILKGDYTQSFGGFEEALHHMLGLADLLTNGIANQFPKKF
ncbi:MAG: glycosyltransferase [Bacteroidetes bacterium]|nr:glycosyltransferase [Bacteroidota bacterium]